jgi:hypothetical protein
MSRYCAHVPGEQVIELQGATFHALEVQLLYALASIPAGRMVTALSLAGSGKGGRFTINIHHGVAIGLDPNEIDVRFFIAETVDRLASSRQAALRRSSASYVLYDTELAGASDGLPVCGMLVMVDPEAGFKNGCLDQADWYIHATNGKDSNDGASAETALATHAELVRRWGNNPTLTSEVRVHILSDLDEVLRMEATFVGSGHLVYTSPGNQVAHTGTVQTYVNPSATGANGTEGNLTDALVTDYSGWLGRQVKVEVDTDVYAYTFISDIADASVALETARLGQTMLRTTAATFSAENAAPGDPYQIRTLFGVRGVDFTVQRNDDLEQAAAATITVEHLVVDGAGGAYSSTLRSVGGAASFSTINFFACALDRHLLGEGGAVRLVACTSHDRWGQRGILEPHSLVLDVVAHAGGAMYVNTCTVDACSTGAYLDGAPLGIYHGSRAGAARISLGVYGPQGLGVDVDESSEAGFDEVWGNLTDANSDAFRVNGRAWYVTLPKMAHGGSGNDVLLGGNALAYANLPSANLPPPTGPDTNDATFFIRP